MPCKLSFEENRKTKFEKCDKDNIFWDEFFNSFVTFTSNYTFFAKN